MGSESAQRGRGRVSCFMMLATLFLEILLNTCDAMLDSAMLESSDPPPFFAPATPPRLSFFYPFVGAFYSGAPPICGVISS